MRDELETMIAELEPPATQKPYNCQQLQSHIEGLERMIRVYTDVGYKVQRPLAEYANSEKAANIHASTLGVQTINKLLSLALGFMGDVLRAN